MKQLLLGIFFLLSFGLLVRSQTMPDVCLVAHVSSSTTVYVPFYKHEERKFSTTTKVGVLATITGPIVFFVGKNTIQDYGNNQDPGRLRTGIALYGAGLFITGAGLGMLVGGGIHDYRKARQREIAAKAKRLRMQHKRSLGYLAPFITNVNEVGIAYHF